MPFSGNFDLDYSNQNGSHFRASTTGWQSAVFKTFSSAEPAATPLSVQVDNVTPQFDAGSNAVLSPVELGVFTREQISFTDPGTLDAHSIQIDWGDGTALQSFNLPGGDRTFDLEHTFAQEGTFTVTVTVQDDGGGQLSDTLEIEVNLNAVPVANDDTATTTESGSVVIDVLANDTDPDIDDVPGVFSLDRVDILDSAGLSISPGSFAPSYSQSVLSDQPLAYFRINESSGAVLNDHSGHGHHGTSEPATTPTINQAGVMGGAARFDGSQSGNGDFVKVQHNLAALTQDFTAEAWINWDGGMGHRAFLSQPRALNGTGWALTVSDGMAGFGMIRDGEGPSGISGPAIVANRWTHIAGTFDGQVMKLYVDGVMVGTHDFGSVNHIPNSGQPLLIGREFEPGFLNDRTFGGLIDEVAVYSGALSAEKLTARHSIGSQTAQTAQIVNHQLVYQPTSAFQELGDGESATVAISYLMSDDQGASSTATVTITVTGENDAPVAMSDSATTNEDTVVEIDVLANDTDVDLSDHAQNFSIDSAQATFSSGLGSSPAAAGEVSIANQRLLFAPGDAFAELDLGDSAIAVVTYSMSDDSGALSFSTVTITVNGVNDAPVANSDVGTTSENESLTVDVLGNDTDPDQGDTQQSLTLQSASVVSTTGLISSPSAAGSVSIQNNQLLFSPGTGFDELDVGDEATVTIDYVVSDDQQATSTGTLTITIQGANDAPAAQPDAVSADENETVTLDVLANDLDLDSDDTKTLQAVSITGTTGLIGSPDAAGSVAIIKNSLVFSPGTALDELDDGDTATVHISYGMSDGSGAMSFSSATITVAGTKDAPVAVPDTALTAENEAATIDVLSNATDADADDGPDNFILTNANITSTDGLAESPGAAGSVTVVNNNVVFDPGTAFDQLDDGDTATVVVSYNLRDESNETATGTLSITVSGANDAPVAHSDTRGHR